MKVYTYTPGGKLKREPVCDSEVCSLSGSGNHEQMSLESGSLILAKRKGEPLPKALPMKKVTFGVYGQADVSLTFEELERIYKFATRDRENTLRDEFNASLSK